MTAPTPLLATPAPEGARLLALDWLERVRSTRASLDTTPDDPEALHALRVALTRLRATLRLYAPVLDGDIGRRGRRDLRAANAALGRVRDRDVQAAQLETLAPSLDGEAQQAARWMRDRLVARRNHRLQTARRVLRVHLDGAVDRWRHRLSHYSEPRIAGVPTPYTPLASIIGEALQHATAALEDHLRTARASADPERLHRARISGKRIRALLVPWLPALTDAAPLFAQATRLQDDLGRARDLHLLATRARRAARRTPERAEALRALAHVLEEHAQAARADVEQRWLTESPDGAATPLLEAIPPAVHAFAHHAHPALEIERKFLLHTLPAIVRDRAGIRIAQGWLPGERLRERLRRSVHPDGRVEWTRTVKVGTGMTRMEIEEETAAVLFETLWPLTGKARVEKVRHAIADGALTWEIDVFLDRDLLLAEVELPSEDTPVSFPAWLAPCVTREVTGDPAYVNANLARASRLSASA